MSFVYNINMAKTYQPEKAFSGRVRPTYDPRIDSGTSGAESSDLNPEQAYDVDLRERLAEIKKQMLQLNSEI